MKKIGKSSSVQKKYCLPALIMGFNDFINKFFAKNSTLFFHIDYS